MAGTETGTTLGGITDASGANQNSLLTEELGRYAVDEYNKKTNALLEFSSVVSVKEQVVSGTVYYLTIEAVHGGEKNLYEAKVWVKPWMNFKELQDFKPIENTEPVSTATASS